ncbi:XdhC family protein [Herbidospora mongoliensis]|uniref:XdhC family protein n=1 Tax=Herbidospora mongoliensis TaxID=688067 RepID=UPI00082F1E0C|nr:XdhC family protein [Herbidospora mongoliensis]
MREVLDDLLAWWSAGETVGVGTVVGTWNSAPRAAGAALLVGPKGETIGSVSGGCVEGAVYDLASWVASDPLLPPVLERYGVSDDEAYAVGLTCGGTIDVFVERVSRADFPEFGEVAESVRGGVPVATVTCVGPDRSDRFGRRLVVWADRTAGGLGLDRLDQVVAEDVRGLLAAGRTTTLRYGRDGQRLGDDLLLSVISYAPQPA